MGPSLQLSCQPSHGYLSLFTSISRILRCPPVCILCHLLAVICHLLGGQPTFAGLLLVNSTFDLPLLMGALFLQESLAPWHLLLFLPRRRSDFCCLYQSKFRDSVFALSSADNPKLKAIAS